MVPPPPPAEIQYTGEHSVNPLGEASFRKLCGQVPRVLHRIIAMSWRIDRRAVLLLLACPVITGAAAAVLLAGTAGAMRPLLGAGSVADRLYEALPALVVASVAAALTRVAAAVATFAERLITPRLTTEADTALVAAVCRVEASAYAMDGFSDRQEAAEMGVIRTHVMVSDAQRFLSALVRMEHQQGDQQVRTVLPRRAELIRANEHWEAATDKVTAFRLLPVRSSVLDRRRPAGQGSPRPRAHSPRRVSPRRL